jgi:hypothetical protein
MSKSGRRRLPREVFLSHASQDQGMAGQIAAVLREHGVPVWFSQTHLLGAQRWHDEIGKALLRCDWFLVLLSPDAVKSTWVKRELVYALRSSHFDGRILPIVARACEFDQLSWTLKDFQAVDFTQDFATGCQFLLRTWGMEYAPGAPRKRGRA